ncbi:MAG: SDR family NAD(P)-dependent oxidoreductase [Polyangiales bacterium]
MTRFRDRVVLVTGASEGIGAACARRFAAEGAKLVLAARRRGPLDTLAAELRGRGTHVLVVPTDVGDLEACERLIATTVSELGGLDVLVNNAGAHYRGPVLERTPAEIATMIDVNARAPLVLSRLALDALLASRGAIVNVASIAGMTPLPDAATYSASKFALRAFSIALAEELRGTGVGVARVARTDFTDTGFLMESMEDAADVVFAQPMSTMTRSRLVVECAAGSQTRA